MKPYAKCNPTLLTHARVVEYDFSVNKLYVKYTQPRQESESYLVM